MLIHAVVGSARLKRVLTPRGESHELSRNDHPWNGVRTVANRPSAPDGVGPVTHRSSPSRPATAFVHVAECANASVHGTRSGPATAARWCADDAAQRERSTHANSTACTARRSAPGL